MNRKLVLNEGGPTVEEKYLQLQERNAEIKKANPNIPHEQIWMCDWVQTLKTDHARRDIFNSIELKDVINARDAL